MHKLKPHYIKLIPQQRLHGALLPIIGLTGGIASGKSSISKILKEKGVPLLDADQLVKKIYSQENSISHISKLAPDCVKDHQIEFKCLREKFFNSPELRLEIEEFIYNQLPNMFEREYKKLDFSSYQFMVYEIPLLFEKKLQDKFDITLLSYCERSTQLERLVTRDVIERNFADKILNHQMDIEDKRDISQFILNNQGHLHELEAQVDTFLTGILE